MSREAWQIDYTDRDGSVKSVVHLHNAIGDYRTIDPNAVVTRLTEPESVHVSAESEHVAPYDRCPTCTAHMPVGQTCGGTACGLRRGS